VAGAGDVPGLLAAHGGVLRAARHQRLEDVAGARRVRRRGERVIDHEDIGALAPETARELGQWGGPSGMLTHPHPDLEAPDRYTDRKEPLAS
jgi:hypothetical protein